MAVGSAVAVPVAALPLAVIPESDHNVLRALLSYR
jgi:hypothetical protein